MTAELLATHADAQVYHASWRELLDVLPRREDGTVCDALIVDAPYSERVHAGHDSGVHDGDVYQGRRSKGTASSGRRKLSYSSWGTEEVDAFVDGWAPRTSGWLASITDHVLAPSWAAALERSGRYVFAPIAFTEPGSRVRLSGDGPSSWTTWIVVARPRNRDFQRWGTLPGAYVLPPGHSERMQVVGGKPLWLMERLVEDYSRPGDLVIDPCAGAFTAGRACQLTGRRFVGGDAMLEHAEIGARRLSLPVQRPMFLEGGAPAEQLALGGDQ